MALFFEAYYVFFAVLLTNIFVSVALEALEIAKQADDNESSPDPGSIGSLLGRRDQCTTRRLDDGPRTFTALGFEGVNALNFPAYLVLSS